MANKVEYGLKKVAFGTYTATDEGVVTLGDVQYVPGAVSLTMSPQEKAINFYADDIVYYDQKLNNGFTGTITMAKFPDAFKTAFLGYVELDDGGLALLKNEKKTNAYMIFQGDGDAENRRHIYYNISFGDIDRAYNTNTDAIDVQTEAIEIMVIGDNGTDITHVVYGEDATGYDTLYTNPPVPALPDGIYDITYDLADGVATGSNPATYTALTAEFTLSNPTRELYTFLGWVGTGLSVATETVTIALGSTGDRAYAATWELIE